MVVELWGESASEQLQLWVTRNHVSWHAFGENLPIGCQTSNTVANGQYCRYVVACGYTPGLFYIQVSDSNPLPMGHPYFRHQIRVTSMNPIDTAIGFGQDFSFDISADLRVIQTVTINGVSGSTLFSNLFFFFRLFCYLFSNDIRSRARLERFHCLHFLSNTY